ncbi:MAG: hypothetical protein FWF52_02940 [Candidatus Azobacteroides sp.]|nr:hypothetical protein [Candidatus Azobacteroides sp.]
MKLQTLYDLQQEINRLFIAGSKFAKEDPRLQKQIPTLQKLGEKAPVFKKLANDLEDLLHSDAQPSADKLMAISILLYSVLYTQGETVESGDYEEKTLTPILNIQDVNTKSSYLQLKPVIDALRIPNSGRLEILKDAFERKLFKDSRTWPYLEEALADKYTELCDFVEKTIIPSIGQPMIPFLLKGFLYKDKTEHQRRLRLLYQLKYSGIPDMIEQISLSSLPSLQVEAIRILSDNPENETLIAQWTGDKNKMVREAAEKALTKLSERNSLKNKIQQKIKQIWQK